MSKHVSTAVLAILALAFTIALTYASIELPQAVSEIMVEEFGSGGETIDHRTGLSEDFLSTYHVRAIGAVSLVLILTLIGVGLLTERSRWAAAGAVALFLPVFGHFALSMSLLAGLGLLRVAWLPIIDHYPALLRFGDVALVPYLASAYLTALAGFDGRALLIYGMIGAGALLFTAGTYAWFQTRFHGRSVADIGIYKISRHPQYLGWIVWSYGLVIYVARLRGPRIGWSLESTLPWIISSLILVCVALKEERTMRREGCEEYDDYLNHTPFLFPVPRFIARIVSKPMRLVIGKEWPTTGKDVVTVFAVYAGLAILLSMPFALLDWPHRAQAMLAAFPYNMPPFR